MKLTVIIPTYRRPNDLPRLFQSLEEQEQQPDEVIVVIGPGDKKSIEIASEWALRQPQIRIFEAQKASVIHSINLGFAKASFDIVCLLDDDVWVPSDWARKIITAFAEDERLGAYGGRDFLQHGGPDLTNPPLAKKVGKFRWNGHEGNHHCGIQKSPAIVDIIKGVNFSFRRSAFKDMKIDPALEGQGAETCWEMDICQRVMHAGFHNLYDNDNYVLHYWSPRLGFDNRHDVFSPAWPKRIYNEALIFAKFRPLSQLFMWSLWVFFKGTHVQPGIIWSVLLIRKCGPKVLTLPFKNTISICRGATVGLQRRQVVLA